ncbi:MAG: DUF547 domain-containing protein [Flavobacteriales bacterium]|nr:DUF547 domain-containing protein [Flavobacteriales bacterium]
MKTRTFYLLAPFAFALVFSSCNDSSTETPSDENDNETKTEQKTESNSETETENKDKAIISLDEDGNQVITRVETKEDGTKVERTVPATAEELREIAEEGVLLKDETIPPVEIEIPEEKVVEAEDNYNFHEYKNLNSLLSTYVSSSGNVNYAGIKANKSKLDEILKEFESNYPGSGWSSAQKLTYWINAYNIYTIKLIVDNFPTSSITKITAKPWHKKFIQLGGQTYSLNQIENDVIRKRFNEPRIHFALNCASESCPILLNRAYTPGSVYGQMTTQTKRFLNDTSKNTYGKKEVQISQIFQWYEEDFTKGGKTVFDFINKYRTDQLDKQKITYKEYSWDLND